MKNVLKRTVALGLVMFLSTTTIMVTQIPIHAQDIPVEWDVTLYFNEPCGGFDTVVFGEASNASDGQDDYDRIEPPFPPHLPYIAAWFDTNLDEPYNKLWYDYRQYPDDYEAWNLSVMWMCEPGNESSTNIDISWNTSKTVESGYESVLLYGDDTVVADMIIENHYKFVSSSGSMNYFQIICQSGMVDDNEVDNNEIPFLYIILIFITIISIPLVIFFVMYRKKNK